MPGHLPLRQKFHLPYPTLSSTIDQKPLGFHKVTERPKSKSDLIPPHRTLPLEPAPLSLVIVLAVVGRVVDDVVHGGIELVDLSPGRGKMVQRPSQVLLEGRETRHLFQQADLGLEHPLPVVIPLGELCLGPPGGFLWPRGGIGHGGALGTPGRLLSRVGRPLLGLQVLFLDSPVPRQLCCRSVVGAGWCTRFEERKRLKN
ncbi:hypothetical protein N658DRAFT_499543 [Parathielavia hyrcaniae]|uniref:Uncharacterized protein n=1 Tax=Parathielavia hyrcaniae TaxID=113614 RepID=A0AAN6SZA9_9PEZI|nr:hypothetical protein N658DRAFT_499543 [Parathielavia hyrcaniae]